MGKKDKKAVHRRVVKTLIFPVYQNKPPKASGAGFEAGTITNHANGTNKT
jgi:hypothetical protein